MKNCRRLFVLFSVVLFAGCILTGIKGSGNVITEPRKVVGFSAVSLSGSGRVIVEQTGTESLSITADDNLLPEIKAEVRGNTLTLGLKDTMTNISPTTDIVYKLTVKKLDDLDISGSGTAEAKGLRTDRLKIEISGSGEVSVDGDTDDLEISISGSGNYRGEKMQSKRASADISGSGNALVAVIEKLEANVSGSGSIEYIGNPQINQQVSGSGSVRRR